MTGNTNYRTPGAERVAMAEYDRAIERCAVACETVFVPTSVARTAVIALGDPQSPPLVLLHGSASNATTWLGDAARFANHFRVYAVDLPGETGKTDPVRPPYPGTAYPTWLGEVFDGLRIATAAVVGLSLGGWCGLRFAASKPDRVTKLALLAPGGLAPARVGFMLRAMLYRPFGMWGIRRTADLVFAPQVAPPGVAEAFAFGLKNYKARRDVLPVVTDDELRALTMPVLFLGGEGDALLNTRAGAGRLRAIVPAAKVHELPGAGHALIGMGSRVLEFLLAAD
jgi:pimeloyl-ACP methyl ester carboxylesterase